MIRRVWSHPNLASAAVVLIAAELMFATMGATIRVLSTELPTLTIVFFRNLAALGLLLPWVLRTGAGGLATRVLPLHFVRALAGTCAMCCFFYALAEIPLATAVLLKLTAPFFLPVFALLWLGERVQARTVVAIVVGFGGVALILQPGWSTFSPIALVGLIGGAMAALAKVTIRRLSVTEPPVRIVFYFAAISSLLSVLPLPWYWVTPSATAVGLLLLIGVFATAGQLLMTRAYAWYPVGPLAPFTYSSVLFAGLFGWLWWDEIMDTLALTGAGIIAVAGMIAATNERDKTTSGWQQPGQLSEHAPPVRS